MNRDKAWALIQDERERQIGLWGREHAWGWGDCSTDGITPELKTVVLLEEAGEVARAVFERDDEGLRDELVQVAAICTAWLESLP